jgi:hypothetical protein
VNMGPYCGNESEFGSGRRPFQGVPNQVLSLNIRRLGFYDLYAAALGVQSGVASGKADG